ncbi:drug/metabolite transporter (DMT)-like permease [Actinoplanes lutulentus]|uniref:Putative MFS family arabinose efflux permease n=1 Tax=Actinoplanes lutulentus TaxID=1287878 RepID=A0A327Z5R7_9ACTN|nr:MFS transporter [Actinoplanes lutulentus]MBB2943435.1 drug/metabolite transporter (DMT)-like permease [Actinoplanes lutulentus]RAK26046.1 putative MFS family arabinose efflux permease [Actinoplanes lutulentus]
MRGVFWIATGVAGAGLWTSAAPSLVYPLYGRQWHLSTTVTTSLFAVFPIALIVVLIFAADLPDRIGHRSTIQLGLAASLAGAVMFALAPSIGWVFAARALTGAGVALSMGPATAVQVENAGAGRPGRASTANTVATAIGVTASALIGGVLIEYAPHPARLTFVVLAAVIALLLLLTGMLPRHDDRRPAVPAWRPARFTIEPGRRRPVLLAVAVVAASYAIGALMFSLGAQIGHALIGSSDAVVLGATIALFAVVIAGVAVLARNLPARPAVTAGAGVAVAGLATLIAAATAQSLVLFFGAAALLGGGYSLLFLGGLSLVSALTTASTRASAFSVMYLLAYLAQAVTAPALGVVAGHAGLRTAVVAGAIVLSVVAVVAATAAVRRSSADDRRPPADAFATPLAVDPEPGT